MLFFRTELRREFFYDEVDLLTHAREKLIFYTFNSDHDNYITMLLKIKEQTVKIGNITYRACYFISSMTLLIMRILNGERKKMKSWQ